MQITIDLDALAHNYRYLSSLRGAAITAAVIKADAYGMGAIAVAQRLIDQGCQHFFVATLPEAISLRKLFEGINLYVLEGVFEKNIDLYQTYNTTPVINDIDQLLLIEQRGLGAILHIDTGMNRLGISLPQALEYQNIIKILYAQGDIAYVMSHMACADIPAHKINTRQKEKFQQISNIFPQIKTSFSNSCGLLYHHDILEDMTRPGIALYGGVPHPNIKNVVTVTADILQIRTLLKWETAGYGADFQAKNDMTIATIGAGYADGVMRILSKNDYEVFANGYHLPLVGRISMDSLMVDISKVPLSLQKNLGQAELIGANNPLDLVAKKANSISYELLTNLSPRYERTYIK